MRNHALIAGAAAIAFAGTSAGALGQTAGPVLPHPIYGVHAGATFGNLAGNDAAGADIRAGFVGGVFATWPVANRLSVQTEALYSMEGARTNDAFGSGGSGTLQLDYIRIPILLRYTIPTPTGVRPYVALGPSFGFQVKCNLSLRNGNETSSESCDDVSQTLQDVAGTTLEKKTFDFAGRLEGGLDFPMDNRSVTIGADFTYGFTNTFRNSDAKNRVIGVFAGIGF